MSLRLFSDVDDGAGVGRCTGRLVVDSANVAVSNSDNALGGRCSKRPQFSGYLAAATLTEQARLGQRCFLWAVVQLWLRFGKSDAGLATDLVRLNMVAG